MTFKAPNRPKGKQKADLKKKEVKARKKLKAKLYVVTNCRDCPSCDTKLTNGYGYAEDYFCKAVKGSNTIAGYVEWDSEAPQNNVFPDFCPLKNTRV